MKCFACCVLLVAAVAAESPRYRNARFQLQKQELAPSDREQTTPQPADAPYPAAGWKPAKEFKLPARQELSPPATSYGAPDTSYGAPLNTYSAPQNEYGVPTEFATESTTVSEEATTANAEVESLKVEGLNRGEKNERQTADVLNNQGAYYVLLPNSRIQRVDFRTENDVRNMAYTARLQYRNEDQAPIYVYTGQPQGVAQSAAYIQYV